MSGSEAIYPDVPREHHSNKAAPSLERDLIDGRQYPLDRPERHFESIPNGKTSGDPKQSTLGRPFGGRQIP